MYFYFCSFFHNTDFQIHLGRHNCKKTIDLIFTDLNSENKKFNTKKLKNKPICLIIGPEGDFSESERAEVLSFDGVKPIKINE